MLHRDNQCLAIYRYAHDILSFLLLCGTIDDTGAAIMMCYDCERLRCVLRCYAKRASERAFEIAKTVVVKAPDSPAYTQLVILSYRIIAAHKCDESEQIMVSYLIDHDNTSAAWEICNSYWSAE